MSDTHAQSVAYVRETAIPASPAPANETGPVKWMRDNLFATWANGLLTVAALYVIYLVLSSTLPWILGGWRSMIICRCRAAPRATAGSAVRSAARMHRVGCP